MYKKEREELTKGFWSIEGTLINIAINFGHFFVDFKTQAAPEEPMKKKLTK